MFYIMTLYHAMNPDVSHEYENYYIIGKGKKWVGHNAYNYDLGDPVFLCLGEETAYNYMGLGWSGLEENFCWTDGTVSELYFSGLPNKDVLLTIKVQMCISDQYSCTVFANNMEIARLQASELKQDTACCMKIPATAIQEGYVEIKLNHQNVQSTETDKRLLGLAVQEVYIDECH